MFFGLNCFKISCHISFSKKHVLEPSRVAPLWAFFSFFLVYKYIYIYIYIYISFSFIVLIFSSFFFCSQEKSFFFSLFLEFLSSMFFELALVSDLTVSSVVGAPWRCGVLTTQGGIAGIGLGCLLGREHASTPQSGVGGSSPVKTEPHQIVFCCCGVCVCLVCGVCGVAG